MYWGVTTEVLNLILERPIVPIRHWFIIPLKRTMPPKNSNIESFHTTQQIQKTMPENSPTVPAPIITTSVGVTPLRKWHQ